VVSDTWLIEKMHFKISCENNKLRWSKSRTKGQSFLIFSRIVDY
jgi:hypothetical protein